MSTRPVTITHRAQRFVDANQQSPLVYQSASSDLDEIVFRLKDDTVHRLSSDEARALSQVGEPLRWAHLQGLAPA